MVNLVQSCPHRQIAKCRESLSRATLRLLLDRSFKQGVRGSSPRRVTNSFTHFRDTAILDALLRCPWGADGYSKAGI